MDGVNVPAFQQVEVLTFYFFFVKSTPAVPHMYIHISLCSYTMFGKYNIYVNVTSVARLSSASHGKHCVYIEICMLNYYYYY